MIFSENRFTLFGIMPFHSRSPIASRGQDDIVEPECRASSCDVQETLQQTSAAIRCRGLRPSPAAS
jgi:hypothetical protein